MSRLSFVRRITLMYALLIVAVTVGSGLGFCRPLRALVNQYSNDKMMHFVLVGMLTLLLNLSMQLRTIGSLGNLFQRGTAIMLLVATCEEFSQAFIPARDFEWVDLASNYVGIVVMGSAAVLLAFVSREPAQKSSGPVQAL